jgi:LCP family protein required for cell wall assembly
VPSPPRAQSDSCGPRGGRLRTLLRRIVVAHVVVFTFMACVLGCGYWYERAKLDEIRRVRDLVLQRATSGRPVNFLIIGSDSRSFVHSPIDVAHFGTFSEHGGQRADTMMVVRIDPRSKRTFIVSFPRDLWVDIPGHGRAKINDAFNWGAQAVIDTLRADFGVRVNHYLEVDFAGFRSIVDALGHVRLFFPTMARDSVTGLFVGRPGCVALDGSQALAYVRSRHFEFATVAGGEWQEVKQGDLGRIRRQQVFFRILADEALHRSLTNPLAGLAVLDEAVKALRADAGLDASDLGTLLRALAPSNPTAVDMVTMPTYGGWSPDHSQAILELRSDEAAPILARLRGQAPERPVPRAPLPAANPPRPPAPSSITVKVLNGSGKPGVERAALAGFASFGFRQDGATVASRDDFLATEVHAAPGDDDAARLVGTYLSSTVQVVSDPWLSRSHVVVVLGRDLPQIRQPIAAVEQSQPRPCDSG